MAPLLPAIIGARLFTTLLLAFALDGAKIAIFGRLEVV